MTKAMIIGGGIGGAATAIALRKAGIDSVVYEAYPTGADDVGAFLTITRNGMDALRAIDSHEPVIANSFPATSVELYSDIGKHRHDQYPNSLRHRHHRQFACDDTAATEIIQASGDEIVGSNA